MSNRDLQIMRQQKLMRMPTQILLVQPQYLRAIILQNLYPLRDQFQMEVLWLQQSPMRSRWRVLQGEGRRSDPATRFFGTKESAELHSRSGNEVHFLDIPTGDQRVRLWYSAVSVDDSHL